MKLSLLLLIFIILLQVAQGQESIKYSQTRIKGHVVDLKTGDSLIYVGIKAFVNDTLRAFGITDYYGYFLLVIKTPNYNQDSIDLQFFYVNDAFTEVRINKNFATGLKIYLDVKGKVKFKKVLEWYKPFRYKIPNYLDCHPSEPIDPYEIKKLIPTKNKNH